VPRIAHHLGQHEQTVRAWIKAFLAGGFDALPNLPRGGGHSAFTPALIAATHAMILSSTGLKLRPEPADATVPLRAISSQGVTGRSCELCTKAKSSALPGLG
jgi:hypothetical protein